MREARRGGGCRPIEPLKHNLMGFGELRTHIRIVPAPSGTFQDCVLRPQPPPPELGPILLGTAASRAHHWGRRKLKKGPMNRTGRRVIFCMLLIAALAIIWNVRGPR
jgi:hypothetical protein